MMRNRIVEGLSKMLACREGPMINEREIYCDLESRGILRMLVSWGHSEVISSVQCYGPPPICLKIQSKQVAYKNLA